MARVLPALLLLASGTLTRVGAGAPPADRPGPIVAPDGAPLCGERDPSLERVAATLVDRRARGLAPPLARELDTLLRDAGAAYVWPAAWAVGPVASAEVALGRLQSWSAARPAEAEPRCGVALWHDPDRGWHAAAVRVDAFVALTRLPSEARRHQWIELEAQVLGPLDAVTVVLLGPRGRPRRILASTDGQRVRSRFTLEQPGRWLVQLVGSSSLGPVPVLETTIVVDATARGAPSAGEVPGLSPKAGEAARPTQAAAPAAPPAEPGLALGRMLNDARRQEGEPPLLFDAELARLAAAHAARMASARRVGHDVGDGSPAERLETANLDAELVGENAAAAASADDAHRVLWASPSHRENMLDHRYRRVGVGTARDATGTLWVAQLFTD